MKKRTTKTWTLAETMRELKQAGTAQNRKVYGRHGVQGEMFGVSFAVINKLKKQIKTNQKLAEELWETSNHDARILATYIAGPALLKSKQIDDWSKELDNYVLTDAFANLVGESRFAHSKLKKWINARKEWVAGAGWSLVVICAYHAEKRGDLDFRAYLKQIEQEIHSRPNRVRHEMNMALIAIGLISPTMKKSAIAAAKRIGPVEVDHGQTSCKTPEAVAYIEKSWAHKKKKKT